MDIRQYYDRVHAVARELDPQVTDRHESDKEVWVTSLDHSDIGSVKGQVVSASVANAAEWIVKQTHRIATAEEIATEQTRRAALAVDIKKQDQEAKGRALPPEIQALASAAAAMTAAASSGNIPKAKGNQ